MRLLIRRFDGWLARRYGVYAFSDDQDCILRLQITRAPHLATLPDITIRPGDPVLGIHLWNERIPPISTGGPDLLWARQIQSMLIHSLHLVAREMRRDPRLRDMRAIMGATVLVDLVGNSSGARLMRRLGFNILPYHGRLGRFGEFWENFYTWWLMWAYNPASLRHRQMLNLRRCEIWISADEFLRRYEPQPEKGGKPSKTAVRVNG